MGIKRSTLPSSEEQKERDEVKSATRQRLGWGKGNSESVQFAISIAGSSFLPGETAQQGA